jgi:hypothetical protein
MGRLDLPKGVPELVEANKTAAPGLLQREGTGYEQYSRSTTQDVETV